MKRILAFVLILMFAIPVFAEPISANGFAYAYMVRAIDLGVSITPETVAYSDAQSFYVSPILVRIKNGVVMYGTFYMKESSDKDTNKRLIAFISAFIEPNPSFDHVFKSLSEERVARVNAFIDGMKTTDTPYQLTEDYFAVYLPDTDAVFVKLLNETP